jgi:DNA-binding XRE family transcriptional regulator
MAATNRVQASREDEGVSKAELSRLAGISERTIRNIEEGLRAVSPTMKGKIAKGFNRIADKKLDYTVQYLFPNG